MHNHHNFLVTNAGFRINPKWPHFGASLDGIVSCSFCGKGVVEIKCPYCHRSEEINADNDNWKNSCLKIESNGDLHLDNKHSYYYKVQTQIFVCDCDFVVCTFPDDQQDPSMHVECVFQMIISGWSVRKKLQNSFNLYSA